MTEKEIAEFIMRLGTEKQVVGKPIVLEMLRLLSEEKQEEVTE